jgi:hypothetical protein
MSLAGCSGEQSKTKLIYFGLDDHSEQPQDAVQLAKTWSDRCPNWRPTINKKDADFQVLFGNAETVTIIGRKGELLYSGGEGVLYLPNGNPDGSGVNICKLTGN